jgi:hypothetical protein
LPGPPDFIAKGWDLQADPRLFCVSHQDTTVWAINLATGQTEALVPGELLWPRPQLLSISPDGRYVALADGYGKVSIWNVLEQHITLQFQAHEEVKATIATKTGIDWDLATRELDWLWTPTRVEGQVLCNDERSAACR